MILQCSSKNYLIAQCGFLDIEVDIELNIELDIELDILDIELNGMVA